MLPCFPSPSCCFCKTLRAYKDKCLKITTWVWLFRLQPDFRIQISQKWIQNGFEVHFKCDFSPFRIQTLIWSYPLTVIIIMTGECRPDTFWKCWLFSLNENLWMYIVISIKQAILPDGLGRKFYVAIFFDIKMWWHNKCCKCQTLQGCSTHWASLIQTTFSYLDCISRSQWHQMVWNWIFEQLLIELSSVLS